MDLRSHQTRIYVIASKTFLCVGQRVGLGVEFSWKFLVWDCLPRPRSGAILSEHHLGSDLSQYWTRDDIEALVAFFECRKILRVESLALTELRSVIVGSGIRINCRLLVVRTTTRANSLQNRFLRCSGWIVLGSSNNSMSCQIFIAAFHRARSMPVR